MLNMFWIPIYIRIKPGFHWYYGGDEDLAIIELKEKVDFIPSVVNPICVPPSQTFDDRPKGM